MYPSISFFVHNTPVKFQNANYFIFFTLKISFCLTMGYLFQKAMTIMGMSEEDQMNVLQAVAGILHLGNVTFVENKNYAVIEDDQCKFNFTMLILWNFKHL